MKRIYSMSERVTILDFASRSLWNGYCSHRNESKVLEHVISPREKKYGRDLKIEDLIDLWEVEVLFSMDVEPYRRFGFYLWDGMKEALGEDSLNLPEHLAILHKLS